MDKEKIFDKLIWIYVLLLGLVFVFMIPPFQHADETQHFFRAASVMSGQIFCKSDDVGPYIKLPKAYYDLPTQLGYGIIVSSNKMLFPRNNFRFGLSRNTYWNDLSRVDSCLPPLGYIPSLLGMWLLRFNPLLSLYAGRITSFLFFCICMRLGFKIIPSQYKKFLYIYCLIPMVIHQATGISYDVVQVSLAILLVSMFFSFIAEKSISLSKIIIFWLIVVWVALSKQSYFLIGLLFLFVDRKKIAKNLKHYLLITFFYFSAYGFVLVLYNRIFGFPTKIFPWLLNIPLQIVIIKNDPLYFLSALGNVFKYNIDFYIKSIIGVFGETDSEIGLLPYSLIILLIGYFTNLYIGTVSVVKMSVRWIFLFFVFLLFSTSIIFGSLFVGANVIGSNIINGIQGRYFLIYLPFILFCFVELIRYLAKWKKMWLFQIVVLVMIIGNVGYTVYVRYFDLSKNIINKDSLKNEIVYLTDKKVVFTDIKIDKLYEFKYDLNNTNGKKIIGFQLDTATNSAYLNLPYKYFIKDENCNKIIRQGYLNLGLLQSGGIYEDLFRAINTQSNILCVSFKPLVYYDDNWNYLRLVIYGGRPLFKFLYADYY